MVSAAHLCVGPCIGHRADNSDVMVGAMTSAITTFPSPVAHHTDLEGFTMAELESPTCTIDLRDTSNYLNIAMTKPGQEIRVIVRAEGNPTATQLMEAVGTLSNDGKSFSVIVTREGDA